MKPTFLIAMTALLIGPFAPDCLGQVGGYREIAVTDKEAIAAADFALETQGKKEKVALGKIVKAEVQVVAGRNFRLTMDVRVEGGIRKAQAIVWAKLDRTYALTKWEWKGDAQPEEKREPKALPGASDGAARPSVSQMASTPCVENAAVLVHWPINFPPSFPGSAWERTTGQALPAV